MFADLLDPIPDKEEPDTIKDIYYLNSRTSSTKGVSNVGPLKRACGAEKVEGGVWARESRWEATREASKLQGKICLVCLKLS